MNKPKIIGLKKAIGDYKRANSGGQFSSHYGLLMYNVLDGTIWTEEHEVSEEYIYNEHSLEYNDYIVNVGRMMKEMGVKINLNNVKAFIMINF